MASGIFVTLSSMVTGQNFFLLCLVSAISFTLSIFVLTLWNSRITSLWLATNPTVENVFAAKQPVSKVHIVESVWVTVSVVTRLAVAGLL